MTTQTLPRLSFAPLEGITGWVFRQVHQRRFPGLDRYYAPFFLSLIHISEPTRP